MALIKVLDSLIASKIAAGEVVERPASVVKELIENSIDARASSITVVVAEGGKRLIKVSDDGEGMSREDASLAFCRHATSKISTEDDLWAIRTMGFRGEALSSISSVARVRLLTRRRQETSGTCVVIEGSIMPEVSDEGCAEGTTIEVADLFFNTPARLKFLRSTASEFGKIADIFRKAALSHPQTRFRLIHGATRVIDSPAGDLRGRISDMFGTEASREIIEVRTPYVNGFIGSHNFTSATSKNLFISVNKRPVGDRGINRAIIDGYGQIIDHGKYPFAVLDLTIPCEDVDINIHPAKSEVRFKSQRSVYEVFRSSVASALSVPGRPPLSAPIGATRDTGYEAQNAAVRSTGETTSVYGLTDRAGDTGRTSVIHGDRNLFQPSFGASGAVCGKGQDADRAIQNPEFLSLEPCGQLWGEFLIAQSNASDKADGTFYLIDQHGAAERIAFERLKKEYLGSKGLSGQMLLIPERLETGPDESAALKEAGDLLKRLGFDVMEFGPGRLGGETFLIKAVPEILGNKSSSQLLKDLAEEMATAGGSAILEEKIESILMRIACHSVIRGARPLTTDEARSLLRALAFTDFAGHCPHGRPVVKRFSRREVEAFFKR
ncbi:MAG: DNA mismatch repair endonuclease MutL [Deltaproteobacteria bacterium]